MFSYKFVPFLSTLKMAVKVSKNKKLILKFMERMKTAFKRTLREFCTRSTIHGLKYVCDRNSNNVLRCIWFVITIIMFGCGILMIITSYKEYISNMTRINIDEENVPVTNLMFPAVTVCPATTYNPIKWQQFVKTLKLPPNLNITMAAEKINLLENFHINNFGSSWEYADGMENLLQINNLTFVQLTNMLRWECKEFILRCRFSMQLYDCNELFQITKSGYGYCCSFNIIQEGLNFTNKKAVTRAQNGLVLAIRLKEKVIQQDYTIIIGPNNGFPNDEMAVSYLSNDELCFISIKLSEQFASPRLQRLSIAERNCVLENELHLKNFGPYLSSQCFFDCFIDNITSNCGCAQYHNFYTNERVCSFKDLPCLQKVKQTHNSSLCNCLPNCNFIDYNTVLTRGQLHLNRANVDSFYNKLPNGTSVLHVVFAEEVYIKYSHDLLSDMLTLVSNLGSSFSLFVGISMVSVIEIFYYFTIVLRNNYLLEVQKHKKLFLRKNKYVYEMKRQTPEM